MALTLGMGRFDDPVSCRFYQYMDWRERAFVLPGQPILLMPGAQEPGGGGARGAITFCLNGMDMPVPPPLKFGNH